MVLCVKLGIVQKKGLDDAAPYIETAALIAGMGAYDVYGGGGGNYNQLISGGPMAMSAQSSYDEIGGITYSHSEYIGDLYGPDNASFTVVKYPVNVGMSSVFPWLSQIAANFEEYQLRQMVVEYRSMVEANQTDSGLNGEIIMASNYNPNAKPFADKATMLQYFGAQSGKVTEGCVHGIECDPSKLQGDGHKFVRNTPVVYGQDLSDYDQALLQIAVNNCPTNYQNQQLGELWVHYTVTLQKPRMYTSLGLAIPKDIYVNKTGVVMTENATAATGFAIGNPTGLLSGQQNSIGCKVTNADIVYPYNVTATGSGKNVSITFPVGYSGNVKIKYLAEGTGLANTSASAGVGNSLDGLWGAFYAPSLNTGTAGTVFGNIQLINDIFGCATGQFDVSSSPVSSMGGFVANMNNTGNHESAALSTSQCSVFGEMHVRVKAATNGVDNRVVLNMHPLWSMTTVLSATCEIEEYNYQYGEPTDSVQLINPLGVLTSI